MTKKHWIIGGGVAVAVLGVGYYVMRRRAPAALGDDAIDYTKRHLRYLAYTMAQLKDAALGHRISDYRSADHSAEMINPPSTNTEAYLKAAYWLAVAARITGSKAAAEDATVYVWKAQSAYNIPGASFWGGSVEQIMSDAAAKLPASSSRAVKSIGVILQRSGGSAVVAAKQQARAGVLEQGVETVKKTADDINPLSTNKPWWVKWAWGAGISVAALLALRFAFSREYHALSGVFKGKEVKQIEMKQEAA